MDTSVQRAEGRDVAPGAVIKMVARGRWAETMHLALDLGA